MTTIPLSINWLKTSWWDHKTMSQLTRAEPQSEVLTTSAAVLNWVAQYNLYQKEFIMTRLSFQNVISLLVLKAEREAKDFCQAARILLALQLQTPQRRAWVPVSPGSLHGQQSHSGGIPFSLISILLGSLRGKVGESGQTDPFTSAATQAEIRAGRKALQAIHPCLPWVSALSSRYQGSRGWRDTVLKLTLMSWPGLQPGNQLLTSLASFVLLGSSQSCSGAIPETHAGYEEETRTLLFNTLVTKGEKQLYPPTQRHLQVLKPSSISTSAEPEDEP